MRGARRNAIHYVVKRPARTRRVIRWVGFCAGLIAIIGPAGVFSFETAF